MIVVEMVEDFITRLKREESVSRFDISLGFKWDKDNSRKLRYYLLSDYIGRADLRHVDLTGADLTGLNLAGSVLTDSDLTGVNLTDSDLRGVDLTGADLKDVEVFDGFSFRLPCRVRFGDLAVSLKNCSPRLMNYLLVQSLAHLSWESTAKNGLLPSEFMKSWIDSKELPAGKVLRVKKKKGEKK